MDDNEQAFFDFLEAREVALQAAAGYFAVANVPTASLEEIATSTSEIVALAARVVLYQRRNAI